MQYGVIFQPIFHYLIAPLASSFGIKLSLSKCHAAEFTHLQQKQRPFRYYASTCSVQPITTLTTVGFGGDLSGRTWLISQDRAKLSLWRRLINTPCPGAKKRFCPRIPERRSLAVKLSRSPRQGNRTAGVVLDRSRSRCIHAMQTKPARLAHRQSAIIRSCSYRPFSRLSALKRG